jgi:hypothetical protein
MEEDISGLGVKKTGGARKLKKHLKMNLNP